MLKDPINVLYDDITEVIGSPKEFKEIKNKYKGILEKKSASDILESECPELGKQVPIFQQPKQDEPQDAKKSQENAEVRNSDTGNAPQTYQKQKQDF